MESNSTRPATHDHDSTSDLAGAPATLTATSESDNPPAAPPVVNGLAGRYELLEEIDRGGMGAIHRAFDRRLARQVAVKVLQQRFAAGSVISGAKEPAIIVKMPTTEASRLCARLISSKFRSGSGGREAPPAP